MFGLGMGELIVVGIIALIFIGPKKLPELAKGLGQGIKEFQKAAKGFSDQLQNGDDAKNIEAPDTREVVENATSHPKDPVAPKATDKKDDPIS